MTANSACEQDIEFNKPQASRPRPHSGRATASSCRCVRLFDDRVALVGREMSRKESHFFGCRHRRQVVQTLLTGTLWLERINTRGHGRPIGQDGRKRDGQDERNQRVKKNKEITKKKIIVITSCISRQTTVSPCLVFFRHGFDHVHNSNTS